MSTAPSAFPILGVPQAPGDESNLPKGSKSLGGRPPEAEGNYPAAKTYSARSVPAASTAGLNVTQQLEKCSVNAAAAVFVDRPTQRASMAQGLFYRGSGRRAVAHTRQAFPKMPTAPSAFPWLGAPQAPGDEPNPP